MNKEINEALLKLENDLSKLRAATDLTEVVRTSAENSVLASKETVKTMQEELSLTRNHIEEWLEELKKSHQELAAHYEESSKKSLDDVSSVAQSVEADIRSSINDLKEKNKEIFQSYQEIWDAHSLTVSDLLKAHSELSERVTSLVKYLDSVNFPARLDKMDSSITTVNTSVQNIFGRLDGVKSDISKEVDNLLQSQQKLEQLFADGRKTSERIHQKTNTNLILIVTILAVIIIQTVFIFL